MNTVWKLAEGARVAGVTVANVQGIGDEIFRLVAQYRSLDPAVLVDAAQEEASPLHPIIYRLDDPSAAYEHRLWVARSLTKSVRAVTIHGEETLEQRVYVNVIDGASRGYMYVPVVMGDSVLREQVLAKAKADLAAWRERYSELQELAEVFSVVDKVLTVPAQKPLRRKVALRAPTISA